MRKAELRKSAWYICFAVGLFFLLFGSLGFGQNGDFGNVFINTTPPDQQVSIINPSANPATYVIATPAVPFVLKEGGTGSLTGAGTATITFGFQPQSIIDPYPTSGGSGTGPTQKFYDTPLVTITESGTGGSTIVTTYNLSLNAAVYGPQPTNVFLTAYTDVGIDAAKVPAQSAGVKVSFRSTTGHIMDLYDQIIIREVLEIQSGPTFCSPCGLASVQKFPNYCDTSTVPDYLFPPPWQPEGNNGGYGLVAVQPFLPGGYNRVGADRVSMYFVDSHNIGNFLPHLQNGTYTLFQTYEWTAPWLYHSTTDCKCWSPLLADTITRVVAPAAFGPPGDWEENIIFGTVVDGTASSPQLQPEFSQAFSIGNAIISPISSDRLASIVGVRINWAVAGSMLQTAATPKGSWSDVASSTNVMQFDFSTTNAAAQFFRMKLPPQR